LQGGLPATRLRHVGLRRLEQGLHDQARDLYLVWTARHGLRTSYGKLVMPGEGWFSTDRRERSRAGRFIAQRSSQELYFQVARVYANAKRKGKRPYREIASVLGIKTKRAGYWVHKARTKGLLGRGGALTAKARRL
jgi:hypothetical protein